MTVSGHSIVKNVYLPDVGEVLEGRVEGRESGEIVGRMPGAAVAMIDGMAVIAVLVGNEEAVGAADILPYTFVGDMDGIADGKEERFAFRPKVGGIDGWWYIDGPDEASAVGNALENSNEKGIAVGNISSKEDGLLEGPGVEITVGNCVLIGNAEGRMTGIGGWYGLSKGAVVGRGEGGMNE